MIAHAWLALWLMATWAGVGAIAWTAIGSLTGGAWTAACEPRLARLRALLILAAMAGLPLLIGASHVFAWIDHPVEDARRWYLDYAFMAWRTLACGLCWAAGWWLAKRLPALALILWLFANGVFATDWIVSLDPAWRSSAIGFTACIGQLSMAMAIVAVTVARESPARRGDMAALFIALCLGWAYMAGIDYLTAWTADQPYEVSWYLPRTQGGWGMLALVAVSLHLVLPCLLLLTRRGRERRGTLTAAAYSVALGEACHLAWLVLP